VSDLALKTFGPLLLALLLMLFVVWSGQQDRVHVQAIHHEQLDAIEDLTQQLAMEYLWLEKYLGSGNSKNLERFRMHQKRAGQELSDVMIIGHNDKEHDMASHVEVEASLKALQQKFAAWQAMADARLGSAPQQPVSSSPASAGLDDRFDTMFAHLIELDEQVESGVRHQLDAHLRNIKQSNLWTFALAAALVLLSLAYVRTAFRRQIEGMRRENALHGKLDASEQNFRNLFELSPVSLWLEDFSTVQAHVQALQASGVVDLRAHCAANPGALRACAAKVHIIDVNQAALRMHGAQSKEQLFAGLEDTFTEESFAVFREEVLALMDGQTETTHQACVRRLDGDVVDVIVSARVMPGHEEQLDRVLVAVLDISQRVKAEESLRESERQLKLAQGVAHIGSWALDVQSGTLSWSDEVFSIFEIDRERFEASYDAFLETVHPEDRGRLSETFARHIEHGEPYDVEHRLLLADGRIKYVHERCETERDAQGKALRSLGTVQDITGRVMAGLENERQREKMEHVQRLESLGVLAGGIAHDFNNLLTAIMGHAALARQQVGPMDRVGESLGCIEDASHKAADLCKQMLAYSGKGKFVVQPINLSELVREMGRLLHVSMNKSAALREELADDLPAIEADVAQMQQVVMNLVINAGEAIGESGGIIVIATGVMQVDADYLHTVYVEEEALEPGGYVYLEVTDNGCGMDTATRKHLFEPFFTTKFTGRGLGMSAIIGIVRGHKGAIKVYSEPGKGTTFKVLFPMVDRQPVSLASPVVQAQLPENAGTVLVVDDEESIRNVACIILANAGFKAMQACDGIEAVEMLRKHVDEIDCVLLDMTMPRMGGEEAFTELRRIKPGIKVLLSSGYNQQTATQRFTGKGLAGFVQKPYTPGVLLSAMQKVLELQVDGD